MSLVTVVDYGMGNLKSVRNALENIGAECIETTSPEEILKAERLILPGVGAFGAAMDELDGLGMSDAIREYIKSGRPFFGICLGQQLLFSASEESPGAAGLDCLPGRVVRLCAPGLKVPEVGWNNLWFTQESPLFYGLESGCYVYFTHSFCVQAHRPEHVAARTGYGMQFDSVVQHGKAFAVQFHPEKSGDVGLAILKNFMNIAE